MAEVEWIKICTDIFDDEKIMLIEAMPEADSIISIWFKLLCLAGKQNNGGVFMLKDKMPYTEEMFAIIFRRPLNTVRLALNTFETFGMVEVVNKAYTITNWELHQNVDKMEEIREYNRLKQRESRAKKRLLNSVNDNVNDMSMTSQECQDIEEEGDKDKESHSFILADKETAKREFVGGSLGKGVVFMSNEQFDDLMNKLSFDEINHYFGVVADCELSGKKFKNKTHYQAILDMAKKDRKIT